MLVVGGISFFCLLVAVEYYSMQESRHVSTPPMTILYRFGGVDFYLTSLESIVVVGMLVSSLVCMILALVLAVVFRTGE